MVWPIRISLDVTPRISAAIEAVAPASTATTPRPPTLEAKRIGPLPFFGRANAVSAKGTVQIRTLAIIETCHGAGSTPIMITNEMETNFRQPGHKRKDV